MKIIKVINSKKSPMLEYIDKYGKHFTIELADFASEQMLNYDGTKDHWHINDIQSVINELGYIVPISSSIGDIIYTANMARADFHPTLLKDIKSCVIYAMLIADDKDGYEGILFCRWLADVKNKNIKIDWNSFI